MTILVDSREKRPLIFCCDYKKQCLPVADYGASFKEGHFHNVVWERKSIGDLFGTLTFGYDRFRRMICKSQEHNLEVIIAIEGTKEKVLKGYSHSARDPESIIKQLETIEKKYGVKSVFFTSRASMANYIVDFYLKHYEEWKLCPGPEKPE